ncbi:MAG: alanine racemase [Verrucomicrobiales bacterium]|jgi:alanine racemase|nr:alanine racemase [Verrucomicrobiales bacterium]
MKLDKLRSWCEIDLGAITHNLRVIRKKIGPNPKILCLVKADAYGHGIVPLARHFAVSDCQMLGVANLQEALTVRKAGVKLPILLLSAPLTTEYASIIAGGFLIPVSSLAEAKLIAKTARTKKSAAHIHLKLNTGMNRLGANDEDFEQLLQFCLREPRLIVEGVFSHYASADENAVFTARQKTLFKKITPDFLPRHICNSAGILRGDQPLYDIVRPGIVVYGSSPLASLQKQFRPALTWKTRVTFTKEITKGSPVSYGCTFVAPRKMTVATLAVGYGDGLFRALSNKGSILIGGKRCKILGRVTMDQIVVNISGLKNIRNGTEAVLIGSQGKERILADEMASLAGTISYEIFCHITPRVPKFYVNSP